MSRSQVHVRISGTSSEQRNALTNCGEGPASFSVNPGQLPKSSAACLAEASGYRDGLPTRHLRPSGPASPDSRAGLTACSGLKGDAGREGLAGAGQGGREGPEGPHPAPRSSGLRRGGGRLARWGCPPNPPWLPRVVRRLRHPGIRTEYARSLRVSSQWILGINETQMEAAETQYLPI